MILKIHVSRQEGKFSFEINNFLRLDEICLNPVTQLIKNIPWNFLVKIEKGAKDSSGDTRVSLILLNFYKYRLFIIHTT